MVALADSVVDPADETNNGNDPIVNGPQPSMIDRFDAAVDDAWGRLLRGRPRVDHMFYLASELADFSVIWQTLALAQGLRSDPRDPEATARLVTALLVESVVVNQGLKRIFKRSRPDALVDRPHHLRAPATSSFPSGHASAAFTAAGIFAQRDPKLTPLIYATAAVVATSRVHVKIHHASDVIGGALLGALFARAATRLWPLPPRP